ncbi:MAG: hypothetical protein SFZ24_11265, partial [Planctomycetota bacterium]|nr:hypothetical protein [Planctomycetota bacterium]
SGVRYCRGCRYELMLRDMTVCPECGRAFDPADNSTTLPSPRLSPLRTRTGRRVTWAVMLTLLMVVGVMHSVIPRPVSLDNWQLWQWMYGLYGVAHTNWGSQPGKVYWWGDRAYKAERFHPLTGDLLWRLERHADDDLHLRVASAGARWSDLVGAFNLMKRSVFGVRFGRDGLDASAGPFEVRGSRVDVLSALVRHFQVKVEPHRVDPDQRYVWVYDEVAERMVTVDLTQHEAAELPVVQAPGGWPLIPPPGSAAAGPQASDPGAPGSASPPPAASAP